MVLEAFQRVWSDFQDLPKSAMFKTMGYSLAFCSKSANFRPLRIHPKSTQTVAQAVTNQFSTVLKAFQRVWSDFQDLPKSAMFKTMGYSPGFRNTKVNMESNIVPIVRKGTPKLRRGTPCLRSGTVRLRNGTQTYEEKHRTPRL